MKHLSFTIALILFALMVDGKDFPAQADNHSSTAAAMQGKCAPLSFIENKGQVTDQDHNPRTDIQFRVAATPGLNIFIGNGAIHYQFGKCNDDKAKIQRLKFKDQNSNLIEAASASFTMYRMDVELTGADKNAQVITEEKQGYYENYFTAATAANGHGVTAYTYNRITYKNIYPHIDWVLYMNNGQLEHEFVINEGGNAADIQLKYGGATDLKLNADGSLAATTPQGVITEQAPMAYEQDGKVVKSSFKLNGDILTYEVSNYSGKLVIDPALVWGTYYGGSGWEFGLGTATDNSSNVYIVGWSNSASGIATSGAYQTIMTPGGSAFLAKFNDAGTIQWATYYGGAGGSGVTTDTFGNVYITGSTNSTSGIATPTAYQDTFASISPDDDDAFLAKFNSAGAIQWATYYGGPGEDDGLDIATDGFGNVYIAGYTTSRSGIATPGAYNITYADTTDYGSEAFLAKFNSTGAIDWATYYGGIGGNAAYGVATDRIGNAYITGSTTSRSGIATPGAYQTIDADTVGSSDDDAFLVKFNSGGSVQWATYYGGADDDYANGVATDSSGNVYITGYTTSASGIATVGAYQTVRGGGPYYIGDVFLAKFNYTGAIQWATYYGGDGDDVGNGIVTDPAGNVYITGNTASVSAIATPGAYQTIVSGTPGDAFLAKFNSTGAILWASYYGGGSEDEGNGVAIDGSGYVYITGRTQSASGIATTGSYQAIPGGGWDVFLAKFFICDLPIPGALIGSDSVYIDSVLLLSESLPGGTWSTSDSAIAIVNAGVITGIAAGTDTIIYSIPNDCGTVTVERTIYVTENNTAVKNISLSAQAITLYPNPAQNELTITSTTPITNIAVSNLLGQLVQSKICSAQKVQIEVAELSAGVYFVKINGTEVKKFVKE